MRHIAFLLPLLSFVASCATSTDMQLNQAVNSKKAIVVPMRISEEGLILLDGVKVGEQNYTFVLDTGATQSAIFENSIKLSGPNIQASKNTIVHGMLKSERRKRVKVAELGLGSLSFKQKSLVVLPNRDLNFGYSEPFEGLIGMDILSAYQVYVSPKTSELKLIPNKNVVTVPGWWDRIELVQNPFIDDKRDLHFLDLRVTGRNTPGLIDTGAEFSVMNWSSAKHSDLRRVRNRLREEWKLQGAVGKFKPVAKVTIARFRSGQKFWDRKDFLIMDFESLEVLGVSDQPFLIAGMNLFKDETFFIDFERNYIAIKPDESDFLILPVEYGDR